MITVNVEPMSTSTRVTGKWFLQDSVIPVQKSFPLPNLHYPPELIGLLVNHSGLLLTLDLTHSQNENYNHCILSPGHLITALTSMFYIKTANRPCTVHTLGQMVTHRCAHGISTCPTMEAGIQYGILSH